MYRIWTFERVWFSELVACVAEALLSPFSAPFLCHFPACYEEWRIGVGPKKNIFFFSPFKKRERERARTREISRQFYDEMKAWSRLKSVFCELVDERDKGSLVLNSTNQFHILMYTLAVVEIIIRKNPCKGCQNNDSDQSVFFFFIFDLKPIIWNWNI